MSPTPKRPTGDAIPRVDIEDDSAVTENPEETVARRTKALSISAHETKQSLSQIRDELKEYVTRDLDEHSELRSQVTAVGDKIHTMNGHLADIRVDNAEVKVVLKTFVDIVTTERIAKVKETDAAVVEKQLMAQDHASAKDHKRKLIQNAVGLVSSGGVVGALIHWLLSR